MTAGFPSRSMPRDSQALNAGPGGTGEGAERGCGGMTPEAPPLGWPVSLTVTDGGVESETNDSVSPLPEDKCINSYFSLSLNASQIYDLFLN